MATTKTKLSIPLILFALLSVVSISGIYYTHQLPTEDHKTFIKCTYEHIGRYDYTAKLKPNTLYSQPTLGPGDGTLYTPIIDHINITFTYVFTSSHQTNITTLKCQTLVELQSLGNGWTKSFNATEMLDMFRLVNTVKPTQKAATTTLFLNTSRIDELVGAIDQDIGTSKSSEYNLVVEPNIYTAAEITVSDEDVQNIYESLTPGLTIEFGKGTPKRISIGDLVHTTPGTITDTTEVINQGVAEGRLASFLATAVTVPLLAITTLLYFKAKSPPSLKPIEKIIAPHKEIIAETIQKPPETTTTIAMASIEDLAKISEALIKPILHTKGSFTKGETTHTFYIIDNNTKYQYTTTAPTET